MYLEADAPYRISGSEVSDETFLAQRDRFSVVEPRPAMRVMTSDEITEFLDEYEVGVTWTPATKQTLRICTLSSDDFPTMKGQTLKEAVGRAATWLKEINGE